MQRVHNITKNKKQLYMIVNTLLCLPYTCAEKFEFRVVQKWVDSEILWKLCALLALESCSKGAQHHKKQKTTLHDCKHLVVFAVNLCRKV